MDKDISTIALLPLFEKLRWQIDGAASGKFIQQKIATLSAPAQVLLFTEVDKAGKALTPKPGASGHSQFLDALFVTAVRDPANRDVSAQRLVSLLHDLKTMINDRWSGPSLVKLLDGLAPQQRANLFTSITQICTVLSPQKGLPNYDLSKFANVGPVAAVKAAQSMWDIKWGNPGLRAEITNLAPGHRKKIDAMAADLIAKAESFAICGKVYAFNFAGNNSQSVNPTNSYWVKEPDAAGIPELQAFAEQNPNALANYRAKGVDTDVLSILRNETGSIVLAYYTAVRKELEIGTRPGDHNEAWQTFFVSLPKGTALEKMLGAGIDSESVSLVKHALRNAAAALNPKAAVLLDAASRNNSVVVSDVNNAAPVTYLVRGGRVWRESKDVRGLTASARAEPSEVDLNMLGNGRRIPKTERAGPQVQAMIDSAAKGAITACQGK